MKNLNTLIACCLLPLLGARAQAPSFTPGSSFPGSFPYAVVDMNGDHLDDAVITATTYVQIFEQQVGGGLVTTTFLLDSATDHDASWSLCAGDIDGNGYNDLMLGGGDGASFLYAEPGGTGFQIVEIPGYIFCQRTNMIDINNDGELDAFSCHDIGPNVYFMNGGSGNLTFNQGIFGTTCGNYGSIWVDYDNDHDMDFFVAKCGCDPVDLFMRNDGGMVYTSVAAVLGFADSHQSWSSAWGDFDNDGDMDVLVGSSSSTVHKLMRNDGGTFVNVTVGSGLDTFGGQSIEWVTHDFNNDGYLDILGGYGFLLGNGDMTFTATPITPQNGPIGDLNNDGFLDIVSGSTPYMNNGNSNHWLTVNTVGTTSNVNGIGARVVVASPSFSQIRDVRSGDGFRYMSSLNSHFGLGGDAVIDNVTIYWPSGIVDVVYNPSVDQVLEVVEGMSTDVHEQANTSDLVLFPDPVSDVLYVNAKDDALSGAEVRITDVSGQLVKRTIVEHGQIIVSDLKPGAYVLQVKAHGHYQQQRFVKDR
jgi:hypothetical protein